LAIKKTTIILLPDGAKTVKQFKIPKFIIHLFSFFLLLLIGTLTWGTLDYYNIKNQTIEYIKLKAENKQQKGQLTSLSHKIEEMNIKMMELVEFDHKLKVMVNLETDDDDNTQFLGIGGSDPAIINPESSAEEGHKNLVRLMHQSLDNLNMEIAVQTQEKAELAKFLEGQKSMFACTPSIWPSKGLLTSGFGYRISPFTNEKEFHTGLDISTRKGSSIAAPADGIVASVGNTYGYGNMITVNHGYGLKTQYAHLDKSLVKKGDPVKRGQQIGLVGNTGRTTGSHLHYEVLLKGVPVNPLKYILN
jgi:murein DD-endopeptidase MepM/ murein hydrolase activator NlpD